MEVLVFKTNLRNKKVISNAERHIDNLPGLLKWNVDLHDEDNVLRIEARDLSPRVVESTLHVAGYFCEELPD